MEIGGQRGRGAAGQKGTAGRCRNASPFEARLSYRAAAEKGLLKILSKMGISTLSSYCGAQIFEALGLGNEVIASCFAGTASPIGGIGFEEIAEDVLARHGTGVRRRGTAPSLPGSRPRALPERRRGPRLGAADRGGAAAGGGSGKGGKAGKAERAEGAEETYDDLSRQERRATARRAA